MNAWALQTLACECSKFTEQSANFLFGVVVEDTDPKQSALIFDAEPFSQIKRVEISVPREKTFVSELLCDLLRCVVLHANGDSADALIKLLGITYAIDSYAGEF